MKQFIPYFLTLTFAIINAISVEAQSRDSIIVPSVLDTSILHSLTPVIVHTSTYKADSIQNRIDQKNIFNYRKKKINMGDNKWNRTIVVMGKKIDLNTKDKKFSLLDINSLAHFIHSKKDNQTLTLQKRLLQEEQDNYVKQIFTPALVERFSNMHNDDSIRMFIAKYAPSYDQIQTMNELDLGSYILDSMKLFQQYP